jgi:hypothetical protein
MDMSKSICGLGHDRRRGPGRRGVLFQKAMQGDAIDQAHDDIGIGVVSTPAEELGYARMPQAPQQSGFAAEAAAQRREVREPLLLVLDLGKILVRAQELHCNAMLVLPVPSFPDFRHPAFADEPDHLEAVIEDIARLHACPLKLVGTVT